VKWWIAFGIVVGLSHPVAAQRWQDATAPCLGTTSETGQEWANKVEVADVDGDGRIDILFANGGDYDTVGANQPARVFGNAGSGACTDISATAVGGFSGHSRMIKAADIDGDGDLDILTGGAYQSQLRLFVRDSVNHTWTDATAQLPQQLTSIGDAEFGDVDGDGDLDIVLADWGAKSPGSPSYVGGQTRLYLNDGSGHFTDATSQLPTALVAWSWDMELVDVDNDFDLDILVSCKLCDHQFLFLNDGTGHFTDASTQLPTATNNYEFEPMDIDGDGDLDLITLNTGPDSKSRLFVNDGHGNFTDETAARIAASANPGADDNAAVWLDVDADGDADLLIASLSGPERLLINDGSGHFTLAAGSSTPDDTPGSLGIAVADLDGDGRLDVVQSQGEEGFGDKVQLATAAVAVDTAAPVISNVQVVAAGSIVHARVHDHQSPSHLHDWQAVQLVPDGSAGDAIAMQWYGEYLWSALLPAGATSYQVCATDRAGNHACSDSVAAGVGADTVAGTDAGGSGNPDQPDAGGAPGMHGGGGCCDTGGGDPRGGLLVLALVAVSARTRRTRTGSGTPRRRRRSA
jgi:hypothetical protein